MTAVDFVVPNNANRLSIDTEIIYRFLGPTGEEFTVRGPGEPFLCTGGITTAGIHPAIGKDLDGLLFMLPTPTAAANPRYAIFGVVS